MRYTISVILIVGMLLVGCGGKGFNYFGDPSSFTPSPYQSEVADFGGFEGDCSSDANFPYYFQCQSERAGGEDGDE